LRWGLANFLPRLASASLVPGITGISHFAQPPNQMLNERCQTSKHINSDSISIKVVMALGKVI
jgi:hypothetical protein